MLLSCWQVVQQLLAQLSAGSEQQRIVAAHTLSHLLETEEAKYRALVGDPHANPNLRSHYAIGKVLSVLKVSNWIQVCRAGFMGIHASLAIDRFVSGAQHVLQSMLCMARARRHVSNCI